MSDIDINGDGKIDEREFEMHEKRTANHRKIAFVALWSCILLTIVLLTPLIPVERVTALSDLISMFYIMMGTVIGAYMGVSGWMTRK